MKKYIILFCIIFLFSCQAKEKNGVDVNKYEQARSFALKIDSIYRLFELDSISFDSVRAQTLPLDQQLNELRRTFEPTELQAFDEWHKDLKERTNLYLLREKAKKLE